MLKSSSVAAIPVALDDLLGDLPRSGLVVPSKVPSRRHMMPSSQTTATAPAVHALLSPINADILDTHLMGDLNDTVATPFSFSSPVLSPALFSGRGPLLPGQTAPALANADWSYLLSPRTFRSRLPSADQAHPLRLKAPSSFAHVSERPLGASASSQVTVRPSRREASPVVLAVPSARPVQALPLSDPAFLDLAPAGLPRWSDRSSLPSFIPSWSLDADTPLPWAPAILLGVLLALRDCALWSWNALRDLSHPSPVGLTRAAWAVLSPPLLAWLVYASTSFRPRDDRLTLAAVAFCLAPVLAGLAWSLLGYALHRTGLAVMTLVGRGRRFVTPDGPA